MNLTNYFDRVVLINLKRRPDRLANVRSQMAEKGWPFKEPILFEGVDGHKVPSPVAWTQGGGTWGCLQSHRQVLERAIMDDVNHLLVLEDDLCFGDNLIDRLEWFIGNVPKDWDQLMLGGQHMSGSSSVVKDGIVRCRNCQRTHAYAIRGQMLRDLYAIWCSPNSKTHCDHIMGPVQSWYNVYAPDPFIFGQNGSKSDISGKDGPTKFWSPPVGTETILFLECPRNVVAELRNRYGVHTGFDREPGTDIDVGLSKIFQSKTVGRRLEGWIRELLWECNDKRTRVLGVWHPKATIETVTSAWPRGTVLHIKADTIEEAVGKLPDKLRSATDEVEANTVDFVVLLRASKATVHILRSYNWHIGYWRDDVSGYDNGLREYISDGRNAGKLKSVIGFLTRETESIPNGVSVLWHPDLTLSEVEMVSDLPVVEIVAESAEDALRKLGEYRRCNSATVP